MKRDSIRQAEERDPEGVSKVREAIRNGTVDPVYVSRDEKPMLDNGHHRVVLAHDMGVEKLPVTHESELPTQHWPVF